ncbi:unnamed protein product [Taenia asiatica]|uniref:Otopetrin-2 n=1 Tax=Taenia asiatica TaxID=60517 RepID=A0A0R3WDL6_TAEAS|nr:unnamed protein product [Taenia asiatica]
MSSLLLLSAIGEGVASFVLPIIDAFGPPKYVEHKFYFEIFQLTQFTISIAALAYLQALMTYNNRKMQRCQRLRQGLTQDFTESTHKHIEEDEGEESGSDGSVETVPTSSPDYASSPIRMVDGSEEVFHGSKPASVAEIVNESKIELYMDSKPQWERYLVLEKSLIQSSVPRSDSFRVIVCSGPSVNNAPFIYEQIQKDDSHLKSSESWALYTVLPAKAVTGQKFSGTIEAQCSRRLRQGIRQAEPLAERKIANLGRRFGNTCGMIGKANPPYLQESEGINLCLRLGTVVFGFGVIIMDGFRVADQFRAVNSEQSCHSILWIHLNAIHAIYIFWQTYFLFKYHWVTFNMQKFVIRFTLSHMAVVNLGQWLSTVVEGVVSSEEKDFHLSNTMHSLTDAVVAKGPLTPASASSAHSPSPREPSHEQVHCHSQAATVVRYLIPCGVEYSLIAGAIFYKMFQRIGHVHHRVHRCSDRNNRKPDNAETRILAQSQSRPNDPAECHGAHKGLFVGLLLFLATLVAIVLFYIFLRQYSYQHALMLYQINYIILLAVSIVFLILEASRREAGETEHTISKPGRTIITFLLVLNLAMWIIITHLSLPLIIFFRFHSTVCLADIWTNAYRLHYRHTEV